MKYIAVIAALLISSCATQITRLPELGGQATAGVGDPIYSYTETKPSSGPSLIELASGTAAVRGDRQEILYSGMSANQLKLVYREFADDFARPAFTQDAQYDYKPAGTVTFKGASIKIIAADNQSITYSVLSGFNNE